MNLDNDGPHPVSRLIFLVLTLLTIGENSLGPSNIENGVSTLASANDGVDQLTQLPGKLVEDNFALSLTHFLKDHLFRRLSRDSTELHSRLWNFDEIV